MHGIYNRISHYIKVLQAGEFRPSDSVLRKEIVSLFRRFQGLIFLRKASMPLAAPCRKL
jgi:hypothetical protein